MKLLIGILNRVGCSNKKNAKLVIAAAFCKILQNHPQRLLD